MNDLDTIKRLQFRLRVSDGTVLVLGALLIWQWLEFRWADKRRKMLVNKLTTMTINEATRLRIQAYLNNSRSRVGRTRVYRDLNRRKKPAHNG